MSFQARRRGALSFLLLLGVISVYLSNGRTIGATDTLPARYLPISILREMNFDLDEFSFLYTDEGAKDYLLQAVPSFLQYRNGHHLSSYGPGPALIALPVYAVPVLAGMSPVSRWVPRLEKLAASLATGFSVLFLFWALRELITVEWALGIALIYAFGTSSFSISSQALWQHGPSQLFIALSLFLLVRGIRKERYLPPVGFCLASAIVMRPTDILIALPIMVHLIQAHRSALRRFFAFALPPLAFLIIYHYAYFGSILASGYGLVPLNPSSYVWSTPLLEGVLGLLFSPGRGLFIYSPILIFSLAAMVTTWSKGPSVFRWLSVGPLLVVLLYGKWFMWWGGWSYGPRLLADITPILCFFLYPVCERMKRSRNAAFMKAAFISLALLSAGLHSLGAFWYDAGWEAVADIDQNRHRLWSWKDSPPVYYGGAAFSSARHVYSRVSVRLLRLPTSRDAPHFLSGSYALSMPLREVPAGEPIQISLKATNTGKAIWLARSEDGRGEVALGWRWLHGGKEVSSRSGWTSLDSDVFPGKEYEFAIRILPPVEPGDYTLELGLISTQVTSFSDQNVRPLRIEVRVLHPVRHDINEVLTRQSKAGEEAPHLAICTDRPRYRPGDVLDVTIDLTNPAVRRVVDGYLALAWPNGTLSFYDGKGLLLYAGGPWVPLIKGFPVGRGRPFANQHLLRVKLVGIPNGPYTWYAVLTEPNTGNVIAKATATFLLEPGAKMGEPRAHPQ